MILVFGSTGTVGGEVTRQLIAAGQKPRLLVRDPVKAKKFEGKAEIIKGDIGDAKILAEALKGADKVFLATAGEGKSAVIDPSDIAAVAVKALTSSGHDSKAYTLTGPQALSTAEQASTLSTIAGKKINYVDVAPEDARASMLKTGMPKAYVDGLMEAYALIRNDQTSTVTNTVEEVTGHRPIPFESWVKKNAGAFK